MNSFFKHLCLSVLFLFSGLLVPVAHAATTPSLGAASSFVVLGHTYSRSGNPAPLMTGNFGYAVLTGTSAMPTVNGITHVSDGTYNQAGADQAAALAALNSQTCNFFLPAGNTVDLSVINMGSGVGIYTPGVYCTASSGIANVTIGTAGITLSGNGTYIFRVHGMLSTAANSVVSLTNGASACDVFWTPSIGPIVPSFGYHSTFVGTDIEPEFIFINDDVTWIGRALVFQGTATFNSNINIILPNECLPPTPSTATLHVIKTFYNDYGGTATSSDAKIHVKNGAGEVPGSPQNGADNPGTSFVVNADTYTVSEDAFAGYTPIFSGACDASGHVTLDPGDDLTCTISNDQNPPSPATLHVIKHVVNNDGGTANASSFLLHVKSMGPSGWSDITNSPAPGVESSGTPYPSLMPGTYVVSENTFSGYTQSFSGDCDASGNILLTSGSDKTCTITNDDILSTTSTNGGGGNGGGGNGGNGGNGGGDGGDGGNGGNGGGDIPSATLHVIKVVVNDNGGKAIISNAIIHVTNGSADVTGSPHAGTSAPGMAYTLSPGTYNVSENFFPGYTVKVTGDCAVNGDVVLLPNDNKTCTITNNDIAGVILTTTTTSTITTPPISVPVNCDICSRLTYDVYIINPDGTERHTGTSWVRVTDRGNGIKRYAFEDATLDPNNLLYDYNDSVIDVDLTDCKNVKFMFISSDASWKHRVRMKVSIDGVMQSDTLVANDSKSVVGTIKVVNIVSTINTKLACSIKPVVSTSLLGKILLQVEQHGEAWYVRPESGLRYYMKNGATAYNMMRNFGLGITNHMLDAIPNVATVETLKKSTSVCASNRQANQVKGKILLQVEQHGEAWYVEPNTCRRIYLKDGEAAYTLMRFLGLGTTTENLNKIKIGI